MFVPDGRFADEEQTLTILPQPARAINGAAAASAASEPSRAAPTAPASRRPTARRTERSARAGAVDEHVDRPRPSTRRVDHLLGGRRASDVKRDGPLARSAPALEAVPRDSAERLDAAADEQQGAPSAASARAVAPPIPLMRRSRPRASAQTQIHPPSLFHGRDRAARPPGARAIRRRTPRSSAPEA